MITLSKMKHGLSRLKYLILAPEDIAEDFEELRGELRRIREAIASDFTQVDQRMSEFEDKLNSVEYTAEDNEYKLERFEDNFSELEDKVSGLDSKVDRLEDDLSDAILTRGE